MLFIFQLFNTKNGWMDGWMDAQTDRWMDGRMNE